MALRLLLPCLALALAVSTDAAALVRFINTVPSQLEEASLMEIAAGDHAVHPNTNTMSHNTNLDRVGLQYYADSSITSTPTIVWTETLFWLQCKFVAGQRTTTAKATNGQAPWAWDNAMPSLRYYHSPMASTPANPRSVSLETAEVDKISIFQSAQYAGLTCGSRLRCTTGTISEGASCTTISKANMLKSPQVWDPYDHSQLKADGVGLYMSFAAGTYRLEAYGAKGTSVSGDQNTRGSPDDARERPMKELTGTMSSDNSRHTFTFEENKVYTLFALGTVQWKESALPSKVDLKVIEESTAQTTFGMASVRFFHAVVRPNVGVSDTSSGVTAIDVYQKESSSKDVLLVSNLQFGSASAYIDIMPNEITFPLNKAGDSTPLKSGDTTNNDRLNIDLRAGTRATIVCAQHDEDVGTVFCRQIPSRVVAYVRLVNDLNSYEAKIMGRFGPEPMNQSPLTVWQSYQYPKLSTLYDGSQTMGTSVLHGHPAQLANGLMPVVSAVHAGTVSGYGEVFVPLYIMDWQTDPEIGPSCGAPFGAVKARTAPNYPTDGITTSNNANAWPIEELACANARPDRSNLNRHFQDFGFAGTGYNSWSSQNPWPAWAPRFKRVNLIVKTAGHATLSAVDTGAAEPTPASNPSIETQPTPMFSNSVTASAAVITDRTMSGNWGIAPLNDRYMEPGEFYTLYITPKADPDSENTNGNTFKTPVTQKMMHPKLDNVHRGQYLEFGWTRDRTINSIQNDQSKASHALVTVVPFRRTYLVGSFNTQMGQDFRGTFTFNPKSSSGKEMQAAHTQVENSGFEWYRTWDQNIGGATIPFPVTGAGTVPEYYPAAPTPFQLTPGEYTLSFTPQEPAVAQSAMSRDGTATKRAMTWDTECSSKIPTTDISVEAGKFYSIFVLDQYGCRKRSYFNAWTKPDGTAYDGTVSPTATPNLPTSNKFLKVKLQEALPFSADGSTQGGVNPDKDTEVRPSFFAAASSTSTSVSLLVAAVLACMSMLFL